MYVRLSLSFHPFAAQHVRFSLLEQQAAVRWGCRSKSSRLPFSLSLGFYELVWMQSAKVTVACNRVKAELEETGYGV